MGQLQKCGPLIMGLSEDKREREYGMEEIFEMIMTVNFPKLILDMRTQIQNTEWIIARKLHHGLSVSKNRKIKVLKENRSWSASLQSIKDKHYIPLPRNHGSKNRIQWAV